MVLVGSKKSGISSTEQTGLRILTQISLGQEEPNIVVKSGLKSLTRTTPRLPSVLSGAVDADFCLLRSCHLCNKSLHPDKDVFMYRGDQGFCSEECRSRQIAVDEAKEMDANVKRRLAASSSSFDCRGCETCKLLEDLRRQRRRSGYNPFSSSKHQPLLSIFS